MLSGDSRNFVWGSLKKINKKKTWIYQVIDKKKN